MGSSRYRLSLGVLYAASFAAIGVLALQGRSFYLTPILDRPHHPLYWMLKPGGSRGHLYGVLGSALMVLMLGYSIRKRVKALRRMGRLSAWLDFHIYCGLIGPLLIILHSSFKVRGLVALSFWSMIAVALSGVLGRYLYVQIPRRRSGDSLTAREVEEMHADLSGRLRERFGLSAATLDRLDRLAAVGPGPDAGLVPLFLRLPFDGLTLRLRLRNFNRSYSHLPRAPLKELTHLVRQRAVLQRRIHLWGRLQELFHYWHVVHKPFAVIMYLFMVVHIGVAMMTGYAW